MGISRPSTYDVLVVAVDTTSHGVVNIGKSYEEIMTLATVLDTEPLSIIVNDR